MREIAVLDKVTIDKIAAGEVVERPASIVKELVENALDAEATAITVEIRDGGISFIRITDNGCGIPKDQVKKAFLRHATSKIRKVEDLTGIASLGFRGEALSSISAVSQMEIITKASDDLTGCRYCIEGGIEKEFEEIGAPSGTTFLVKNLFFNTPARSKFLKSAVAEANQITGIVEQIALSHPGISFKYIVNGQNKLYTNGNHNVRDIIYQVYGRDITKELLPIENASSHLRISGFIGNPVIARGNRSFENYFVNGRYVKSKLIAKAIEDGYHGFMMQHKYPFTLLYLEIDGEYVDVNVHPAKLEVRFSDQEEIYHQICLAIQNTLFHKETIREVTLDTPKKSIRERNLDLPQKNHMEGAERVRPFPDKPAPKESYEQASQLEVSGSPLRKEPEASPKPVFVKPEPGEETVFRKEDLKVPEEIRQTMPLQRSSLKEEDKSQATSPRIEKSFLSNLEKSVREVREEPVSTYRPVQLSFFEKKESQISEQTLEKPNNRRIIGQVFETYWLVEYEDTLYIIDQHAAHEKVLYEQFMKEYEQGSIATQMLNPPYVFSVSSKEAQLLDSYGDLFASFGYEIEHFGGKEYKVNGIPCVVSKARPDELFREILDGLDEGGVLKPNSILDKLASMSCKAAVKGNQKLSYLEAEGLVNQLLELENPHHCPHGRPTIVAMTHYELDKKFKRIL